MELIGFTPEAIYINEEKADLPDWAYDEKEDGTLKLVKYYGDTKKVNIPSQIDEKTVTEVSLGYGNSLYSKSIEEIIIPNTITSLEISKSSYYSSVNKVSFPNGMNSEINIDELRGGTYRYFA